MLKKIVEPKEIKSVLDLAVMDLALNLNLGNTVNDFQVKNIVEDLLHEFPNESIEDFLLVFKNARHGHYGTIYRLDIAVIFQWVRQHLEEKYIVLEDNLMNEKENEYRSYKFEGKQQPNPDGSMPSIDVDKLLAEYLESIKRVQMKVPMPLTKKQIIEEGGEKPKAKKYVSPSVEYVKDAEIHRLYLLANYDPQTGNKKECWLPENEWRELTKDID